MGRVKPLFFGLFTLIVLVLLFLAGAEIILRKKWQPPKGIYDYSHPMIGRRIRPGGEIVYHGDEVTGFAEEFTFKAGPIGYRTDSVLTREKPEGAYRIFFLGASTTACSYLPQEFIFSQKVEDKLNAAGLPQKFQTANAGVDGNSVRDTLAILNYDVLFSEPDCVVVMHAINDLVGGLFPDYAPGEYNRDTRRSKARNLYEETFGPGRPYVYLFYKSFRPIHSERFTLQHILDERRQREQAPEQKIADFPNLIHFSNFMKSIIGTCQARGVRLILMTQPSLFQPEMGEAEKARLWCAFHPRQGVNPDTESMTRGMALYNDETRNLAATFGVELLDLETVVPKTVEYMYDDVHYTVKGNELVADTIASFMKDRFAESPIEAPKSGE